MISPLTFRFKMLFQQLCEERTEWDEPLAGKSRSAWEGLASDLRQATPISIPRCCIEGEKGLVRSYSLQGFCDASLRAYAAVIYLQADTETGVFPQFLCAKTSVAPVKGFTIPRLELMSALLLARLISSVGRAQQSEVKLEEPTCYTDSQVALYWIQGEAKEWKQFVQNSVTEIRGLVPIEHWRHCTGVQNPLTGGLPFRAPRQAGLMAVWTPLAVIRAFHSV